MKHIQDLKLLRLSAFILLTHLLIPFSPLWARDQVDSYEKLALLRQATGETSSTTDSFQQRLDTIFETDASSPSRAVVEGVDQAERMKVQAAQKEEALVLAAAAPKVPERIKTSLAEEERAAREKEGAGLKPVDTRANASESVYLEDREKILEEIDLSRAEQAEEEAAVQAPAEKSGDLAPSLANNPFYFKGRVEERNTFESSKPVVISRLMQTGLSEESAQNIVQNSVSQEDLILMLMEEYEYAYGEAADLTRTTN